MPSSTDVRLLTATSIHYSRVALIYARRPSLAGWLAGWPMGIKSTISVRASRVQRRFALLFSIAAPGPSLEPGLRRRVYAGAVCGVYAGLLLPVTMLLGSQSWPGSHKPIPLRRKVDRPSRI